jgi:hypothetical protein
VALLVGIPLMVVVGPADRALLMVLALVPALAVRAAGAPARAEAVFTVTLACMVYAISSRC